MWSVLINDIDWISISELVLGLQLATGWQWKWNKFAIYWMLNAFVISFKNAFAFALYKMDNVQSSLIVIHEMNSE